jgi:L-lysine 2,3-aminomutase
VVGVSHFVTDIEKGQEMMNGFLGNITGFSVPNYIIATELGKIPLNKQYVQKEGDQIRLEGYQGNSITYSGCEEVCNEVDPQDTPTSSNVTKEYRG